MSIAKSTFVARQSVLAPSRRVSVCKAASSGEKPSTSSNDKLSPPDWVPEQGAAVLDFLNAKDFDIKQWGPYKQYLEKYVNDPAYADCVGWKSMPEMINGRLAMLGFLAGASAEILGAGPILKQLAAGPQVVLLSVIALTAGSVIPYVKGVKGEYLESLRETYTIPEGVFTEANERVHARLAMTGLGVLILIEMIKGSALL